MNKFEVIVLNSESKIVERHLRDTRSKAESLSRIIEENMADGYSVRVLENR